jgi:NTP pyrophosphatase (non-canonical NTP hydrolase)
MDFDTYQRGAITTDRVARDPSRPGAELIVPLLGLAGEAGQLLSEYKKHLRDGPAYMLFRERVCEELGDILWYVSNVASKFELKLGEVAALNLQKTKARFLDADTLLQLDAKYPEQERFPRQFDVEFAEIEINGVKKVQAKIEGVQVGAALTDNAYDKDGYGFHDVFHLAYVAVLGWSPVIRALLKRKRKSCEKTDEVEDGGRAQVIEEGVVALVFDYARAHNMLEGVNVLDFHLIRAIQGMTSHLEVRARTASEWQRAILLGYSVWREVLKNNGGVVSVDLDKRDVWYVSKLGSRPTTTPPQRNQ